MNERPCSECPWLTSNHGKLHAHGWYTDKNRNRLWSGLRRGDPMSCHRTDPDNVVPEGGKQVPDDTQVRECIGAVVLQQREFMRFQSVSKKCADERTSVVFSVYRKRHPGGMTLPGLRVLLERGLFGGTVIGGPALPRPDLAEAVSHKPLVPWTKRDVKEC